VLSYLTKKLWYRDLTKCHGKEETKIVIGKIQTEMKTAEVTTEKEEMGTQLEEKDEKPEK